jgi:hypothetical protein
MDADKLEIRENKRRNTIKKENNSGDSSYEEEVTPLGIKLEEDTESDEDYVFAGGMLSPKQSVVGTS